MGLMPKRMRGLLYRIDRMAEKLDRATKAVCVVLGGSMALVVICGVIARYVMQNPMVWTEEISRALMIWVAFLGISISVRRRSHIGVELIISKLPIPWQRFFKIITDGLTMWFLFVLTVYGIRMVETSTVQIETATGISMSVFFICVPLCGLLAMIQLGVVRLFDLARFGNPNFPFHKHNKA